STFGDVAPNPWDARPSCRAFLYVVTAIPSSAGPAAGVHPPALLPTGRPLQMKSNIGSVHGSCFRVGKGELWSFRRKSPRTIRAFG
ncbi:hypothetical protein ACXIU3_24140, partial [Vibrio parahaemolyticus]